MGSVSDAQRLPDGAADRLRVHACQRTLRWVAERAESWTANRDLGAADLVLLTIFARSTRTYEAIVRWLGERGFGEQGLMLNRSLFEDMVDAHWVHLNPDLAVERLSQHDLYSRLLRAETQRRMSPWFDGRKPPRIKVSNDERKALRTLFGRGGSRSWTGVAGVEDRLETVIECWKSDADRDQVRFFSAWVLKALNETLHPSGFSLARLGAPTLNACDSFEWRFGSTLEWLTQSLYTAFWTYHQTVGLIIERFALETAAADAFEEFERGNRDFKQAGHWERTGRMGPLPGKTVDAVD